MHLYNIWKLVFFVFFWFYQVHRFKKLNFSNFLDFWKYTQMQKTLHFIFVQSQAQMLILTVECVSLSMWKLQVRQAANGARSARMRYFLFDAPGLSRAELFLCRPWRFTCGSWGLKPKPKRNSGGYLYSISIASSNRNCLTVLWNIERRSGWWITTRFKHAVETSLRCENLYFAYLKGPMPLQFFSENVYIENLTDDFWALTWLVMSCYHDNRCQDAVCQLARKRRRWDLLVEHCCTALFYWCLTSPLQTDQEAPFGPFKIGSANC